MAILAGNIGLKISSRLQFSAFYFPWVRKNNAILCLKGKDYSLSAPVRYVSKKSSKINEPENPLPTKGLDATELRIDVTNNGRSARRSIISDEKFLNRKGMTKKNLLFDDVKQEHELMEEPKEVVEEIDIHQENDIRKHNVLQAGKTMKDVENYAIKVLATRAFTAVELRKKLNGKKFPPTMVEAVMKDFQSRGLINDSLYAETFSRSRWSSSSWGPSRIKQVLFNKGISKSDAEMAVKLVFNDTKSDEDQESKLGMSKHAMDQLFVQASKQWLRSRDAPKETRKSRIVRWLQYRGFNWGVTGFIVKKLESQYPP